MAYLSTKINSYDYEKQQELYLKTNPNFYEDEY